MRCVVVAADDASDTALIERILGEYREMPGLALTVDQAQRYGDATPSHVGVSQMSWWSAVCCDGRANVASCGWTRDVSLR